MMHQKTILNGEQALSFVFNDTTLMISGTGLNDLALVAPVGLAESIVQAAADGEQFVYQNNGVMLTVEGGRSPVVISLASVAAEILVEIDAVRLVRLFE